MPVIRRKLDPNEVYSTTTRYDEESDTVQSLINGTWTDNPAADPRNQTLFPPRTTSNTKCDAAESVADAFENQIDGILTLISESQTAFTIAGAILALFEFGPFGLIIVLAIALAHILLDAGTSALSAALTSTVWHLFACILFCNMDSSGRIKSGALVDIANDIDSQIGGLAATVLKAMIALAGEGGMNNLASLGTATGDCDDCSCGCDTSLWDILTFDGTPCGVLVSRDETGLTVQGTSHPDFGGINYLVVIQSNNLDQCCVVESIDTIIGDTFSTFYSVDCGEALWPATGFEGPHTLPDATPKNTIHLRSANPFTCKINIG